MGNARFPTARRFLEGTVTMSADWRISLLPAACIACNPGYPDRSFERVELEEVSYNVGFRESSQHALVLTADGDNHTELSEAELRIRIAESNCGAPQVSVDLNCAAFDADGLPVPLEENDDIAKAVRPPGSTRILFHELPVPGTMDCTLVFVPEFSNPEGGCVAWGADASAYYTNGSLLMSLEREKVTR